MINLFACCLLLFLGFTGSAVAQRVEHNDHGGHGSDSTSSSTQCPMGSACESEIGICDIRPNPCKEMAHLHVMAPTNSLVRVTIYNASMVKIRTLVDRIVTGNIDTHWNGTDDSGQPVAAGVYFCRMECSAEANITGHNHALRQNQIKKILLTR